MPCELFIEMRNTAIGSEVGRLFNVKIHVKLGRNCTVFNVCWNYRHQSLQVPLVSLVLSPLWHWSFLLCCLSENIRILQLFQLWSTVMLKAFWYRDRVWRRWNILQIFSFSNPVSWGVASTCVSVPPPGVQLSLLWLQHFQPISLKPFPLWLCFFCLFMRPAEIGWDFRIAGIYFQNALSADSISLEAFLLRITV